MVEGDGGAAFGVVVSGSVLEVRDCLRPPLLELLKMFFFEALSGGVDWGVGCMLV